MISPKEKLGKIIIPNIAKKDLLEANIVVVSKISYSSKEEIIQQLNKTSISTNKSLKSSTHIIITLGTSSVYRLKESGLAVANCHKVPQVKFQKELLSITEIIESIAVMISLIKEINPTTNFIFTVSPVRHIKDGFIENQQSKAHLITALHQVIKSHENSFYFPSYEIMMDELRDYRFYKEDMIHPNKTAINYIWGKFMDTWFSEETKSTMKEIDEIQKGVLHRPFHEDSEPHQQFLLKLEQKKSSLQERLPFINF